MWYFKILDLPSVPQHFVDEIIAHNEICQLSKGLKGGDVIAIVILPRMQDEN